MKAISVREPWAWAILHAGKRIENRPRASRYRGPVLLHASAGVTREEFEHARSLVAEMRAHARSPDDRRAPVPDLAPVGSGRASSTSIDCMPRGGLCGIARIVGCEYHPETWPGGKPFEGWAVASGSGSPTFGLLLADVRPLPFIACKGALGVPFDIETELGRLQGRADDDTLGRIARYRAAWTEMGGA